MIYFDMYFFSSAAVAIHILNWHLEKQILGDKMCFGGKKPILVTIFSIILTIFSYSHYWRYFDYIFIVKIVS